MPQLPSGTVTFLFTDLEGSTRLWQEHPDAMQPALARHDEIVRDAIESHDGYVVKTTGDGFHAAFAAAHDAVNAAVSAQLALGREPWGDTGPLVVRMGIHSGPAELRDGDYYGTAVNRAARLMSAAHGGQIVVSLAAEELVQDAGVELVDLGEHNLRDLARSERVFQVVAGEMRRDFPRLQSLDAFPGNLPLQTTSFVGRDAELVAIAAALESARLVTLTGVGGVGKTRLSLQVAAEVLPRFRHGAWFCELATAVDDDSLLQVVVSTLGVTSLPGRTLDRSIVEFLRAKSQLLVFDNCEHLLDEASRLAEAILRDCPDTRILASSREGLGVPGEQMLAVRSLPVPATNDGFDAITHSDAVALFAERAGSARAGFVLEPANAPAVVEICRRLDGIPLAIELAAARVGSMNPSDIAAHIDERFRLLTGGRRTGIERHQTLRATVDWSYSLLEPAEQAVFDRLGVFSGGFDGAGASAVVTGDGIESWDVLDALGSLVAKSMVTLDDPVDGEARYHMLETLRAYARERLDERAETDAWRRRHAARCADLAEEWGPALRGRDELAVRRRLHAEVDNVRAAVTWALDRDDPDDQDLGVRILIALLYETTMDRSTGYATWAEHALRRVTRWPPGSRNALLAAASQADVHRGDFAGALEHAEASVVALDPTAPGSLLPYVSLGAALVFQGRADEAVAVMREAIARFDAAGAGDYERWNLLSVLLTFRVVGGDPTDLRDEAAESVRLARRIGNPSALAIALSVAGISLLTDDPKAALSLCEESMALTVSGASDVTFSITRSAAAAALAVLGNRRGALEYVREALRYSAAQGDRGSVNFALSVPMLPLIGSVRPELALVCSWALDGFLSANEIAIEAGRLARDRAQDELGAARYAELRSGLEALSFEDTVDLLLSEFDREIVACEDAT